VANDGDAGPKKGGSKHRDLATAQNNLDDDSGCERITNRGLPLLDQWITSCSYNAKVGRGDLGFLSRCFSRQFRAKNSFRKDTK